MQLELLRTYYADGTNDTIIHNAQPLCYTIELPWRNNATSISCIPEGSYFLVKRFSPKFQWHLQVMAVPNRDLILINPANNALTELKGCIATVSSITGHGFGTASRAAVQALRAIIFHALDKVEDVLLVIGKVKPSNVDSPPSTDDR
jgi:hypothetical protein